MRLIIPAFAIAIVAFAQSATTTYTPDLLNGGSVTLATSSSSDHTQAQVTQSLNGRQVPLEQHEERVISRDANGSVTETIVRKYSPNGDLVSTDRTVTEKRSTPGGGSVAQSTVYRSGINGGEEPIERRTVDTRVSGSTTSVNTVVDRPGLEGAFQTIEKRKEQTDGSAAMKTTTESVYHRDANDGFAEAERKVTTQTTSGGKTVVDTTDYEPGSTVGALQFQEKRVATTVVGPNGAKTTLVDVYAPSADGHVQDSSAPPQLKQEQIITQEKRPDGSVAETFSIREPTVSDATHLGPPRTITQTVCTGKCDSAPVQPPPTDPAAKP